MRTMLVACLAIACAACTTSPVSSAAKPVPSERVLAPDLLVEQAGTGKVTVMRDAGVVGPVCSRQLLLNRRPIALLNPGERIDFYVSPGEYILGTRPTGVCGGGLIETTLVIATGQWKSFRIHSDQRMSAQPLPTAR